MDHTSFIMLVNSMRTSCFANPPSLRVATYFAGMKMFELSQKMQTSFGMLGLRTSGDQTSPVTSACRFYPDDR
jgi:hypothetical protein